MAHDPTQTIERTSPMSHPDRDARVVIAQGGIAVQTLLERPDVRDAISQRTVHGRMQIGEGAIDGGHVSEEDFAKTLDFIAGQGLTTINVINQKLISEGREPISNIFDIPGNCMDGRRNYLTLDEKEVDIARPKVVGGPVLFLTDALSIAGAMDGPMLDRFGKVANSFSRSAAMHVGCGMAAKGSAPVLENYHDKINEINSIIAELTDGVYVPTAGQTEKIKRGLSQTIDTIYSQTDVYNEESMIEIVKQVSGPDAVLTYEVDEDHPTHSHEEAGIVYLFSRDDLIMVKDAVADNEKITDVFYQNAGYGYRLIERALGVMDKDKLDLAQIIGLQLPIAANATLGRNQWLGSIGDFKSLTS